MLQTDSRVKGQSSEIFGVVIMIFIGAVLVVAVIDNYVKTRYFDKETSNWSMARDIAYRVVECSSTEFGIINQEMVSGVKACLGLTDLSYKFTIKNLDTEQQWQDSNLEGSAAGNVKDHILFVSIQKPDRSIDRGVVYVTLYPK